MICYWNKFNSPIGLVYMAATDDALVYCSTARTDHKEMHSWLSKNMPDYILKESNNSILNTAKKQLVEYLLGESKELDVPLNLTGTQFQKNVWQALQTIPYGETRTYGQIAKQIGNPKAARPVGQANNKNPISYFVPWHRVIGAGGALVGFGGGLNIKSWLLNLEGISHSYKDDSNQKNAN